MIPFLLLTLATAGFSQTKPDFCKTPSRQVRSIKIEKVPNYFFKISPDGRYVYYITDEGNRVRDNVTGIEKRIPGDADPVPSIDGKILTYLVRGNSTWDIQAQSMNPPWAPNTGQSQSLAHIPGSYQSVGRLEADGMTRNLLFQDDMTGNILIQKIVSNGTTHTLKPHATFNAPDLRLPMMSPDGKYFSVLNTRINKSQIYRVNGSTVSLVETLPFAAGKAAFSYDNKKITFHIARYGADKDQETMYPATLASSSILRNVYVYDLPSKKITQVTHNTDNDSYFPVFLGNGSVAYINSVGSGSSFEIQISSVPGSQSQSYAKVEECFGNGAQSELMKLGNYWAEICEAWDQAYFEDGGVAIAAALSLSPEQCKAIAAKKDKEMLKLCDALAGKKVEHQSGPVKEEVHHPGRAVFQNRCAMCHEGQQDILRDTGDMVTRLGSDQPGYKMPPNGSLSDDEKSKLIQYIQTYKR